MPIIHKENNFVKKKMAARLSSHQVHYSKSLLGIIFNGFCFINLIIDVEKNQHGITQLYPSRIHYFQRTKVQFTRDYTG